MIELFSGVGFQRKGVEDTGLYNVESIGTSEIDINACISYAAIHCGMTPEMIEGYDYPSRQEMADYLHKLNIGYDFKKQKEYDWQKKVNGKDTLLNKTWLACKLQNNYGDVSRIEHLDECDILTYSSSCQDYSIAGNLAGTDCTCMKCGQKFNPLDLDVNERDKCPHCGSEDIIGTRSGQLVEVERLLIDLIERNMAPKFLLQENVANLVSKRFKPDFDKWCVRLEKLGYVNYWTIMNTKFTGIPQNRERVYMLSVRKDIDASGFEFPLKFDNGIRLKDILDTDVDEKYYINNERAEQLIEDLIVNGKLVEYV